MGQPAATKGGGKSITPLDVCYVPAPPPPAGPGGIPTPFLNVGPCNSTDAATTKVLFKKKGVCVENSEVPSSRGDEAGCSNLPTPKGLASQKNMDKVRYKTHSSKVKAEGKGIVTLMATTAHNGSGNMNAPMGKHSTPSQTKVIVG